jgi:hypothetical protein
MILLRQGYGGQAFLRQGYGGQVLLMLAALVLLPIAANAQEAPALRAHRFTIEAAMTSFGGYGVGSATAELRGNAAGTAPPSFTLLTADSRVRRTTAPEFRAGFALTRRLAVEVSAAMPAPRIGVAISNDAEAPAQQLFGEELTQYIFGAGVTWQVPIRMGSKMSPFVSGGGAFLRQLHEDRTLGETGEIYYAGVGARFWIRGGHAATLAIGLRGDARVNLRRKGIDFEDKMRTYPTFSFALFVGL